MTKKSKRPVTVITGYLGAGKTTLINRLLSESTKNIGVLVNDFGALNIDADLIRNNNGTTMELTNGCMCCQLTDDLADCLGDLSRANIEEVIIEASGVALPGAIVENLQSWPDFALSGVFNLVDPTSIDQLSENRFARKLILKQIAQADILLFSKTDLLPASERKTLTREFIKKYKKPAYDLNQGDLKQGKTAWILDHTLDRAIHEAPLPDRSSNAQTKIKNHSGHEPHPDFSAPAFSAMTVQTQAAINRDQLDRFLAQYPAIVRGKGWFTDTDGQCWLLQSVGNRRSYEKQSTQSASKLVFIFPSAQKPVFDIFKNMDTLSLYRL
ncbi:MAG: GTP-binding protein [Pseudomonadales bacterium]|nr:GTP-binding protein [Pseudomonadales bacterium]